MYLLILFLLSICFLNCSLCSYFFDRLNKTFKKQNKTNKTIDGYSVIITQINPQHKDTVNYLFANDSQILIRKFTYNVITLV